MTTDRTHRKTGRAIALAAIVVLSVLATATAFAGAAAASDDVTYTDDGEESTLFYQGQTVVASGPSHDATAYALRQVTASSGGTVDSSTYVETVAADDAGEIELETSDLDAGEYFLSGPGIDTSTVDTDDTFELTIQRFRTAIEDQTVAPGGQDTTTDLDVASNRGTYSVNVSADGDLDAEELFGIFADGEYDNLSAHTAADLEGDTAGAFDAGIYDEREADADEKIVLVDLDDREATLDFTGIDEARYDLEFEVVDTEAVSTVSVDVGDPDVDASFDHRHYAQSAGDVVEFTVDLEDTDDAYVQFGDADAGYVDVLYLADDTGSGDVTVRVNTRTAGAPATSTAEVFHAEDDVVQSLVHDGGSEVENATFYDAAVDPSQELEGGFTEYLAALDLVDTGDDADEQLTRPLQEAQYDLTVTADGYFVADDADHELDRATLDLTPPSIESVSTSVASADSADRHTRTELREFAIERTTIADGDRLIVDADASGLTGALLAAEGDWDALEDGFAADSLSQLIDTEGEGISFEVEADDATGNQEPISLALEDADSEAISVFVDAESGALAVVVDTGSSDAFDGSLDDEMAFTATLAYETDADERYAFGDSAFDGGAAGDAEPAYPYVVADADESATTEFDIAEPTVTFDDFDDDAVQLATDETVLTGETTVAPGTPADIRLGHVADGDDTFLHTIDTTIGADGSFESDAVDLGARNVDERAALEFRVDGSTIGEVDGIFVEELADDTDDQPDESDDEPVEATDEPVETDDGSDDATMGDDSVPGFGVAVAVVALLAAGLAALGRQR